MNEHVQKFFDTKLGQALFAFFRVSVATILALWVDAGLPMRELSWVALADWIETGAQAGAGLVIVNYFAPWERRYGTEQPLVKRGKHR